MNFAAIVHEGVMSDSRIKSRPVQFCLAQHFLNPELETYARFYTSAVAKGRLVILDNGVYEGQLLSFQKLWDCIQALRPKVVVLPDVMKDPRLTDYLHESFLDFVVSRSAYDIGCHLPQHMSVLHHDNIWDLVQAYQKVSTPWVGLPRHLGHLRRELCSRLHYLNLWRPELKVHALGMINGDVAELAALARLGVASADSSNPVWRNCSGKEDLDPASTYSLTTIAVRALQEIDQCTLFSEPTWKLSVADDDVLF